MRREPFDPERVMGGNLQPAPHLDQLAHEVIGAAIEVHRQLGPGYMESVYQAGLGIELGVRGIPHIPQFPVTINYKGQRIGDSFLDFLVGADLVVEIEAVEAIAPVHTAQVISYLKATRKQLGLLINFNVPVLRDGIRRLILNS